ncbi:hypothetical protein [Polaromonas sp.]|uniref:hypothetical protein n=1 Tax=Polaromonas sp. TaxID=1869339 RepID=UPI0035656D5B
MTFMNRILRTIAPSFAWRRQVENDEWTKQIMLQVHMSFIDDEHSKNTTTSNFLQQQPESLRNEMMRVVLNRISAVVDSADRKLACRRWVLEEAKAYAPVRSLFVSTESYHDEVGNGVRHPLNQGLWDYADSLITQSLKPLLDEHGSVEEVKNFLRRESMWLYARLEFANTGRLLLDDKQLIDGEDWVCLLLKLLVTEAEVDYLDFLGVPQLSGVSQLRADIARLKNVLFGSSVQ